MTRIAAHLFLLALLTPVASAQQQTVPEPIVRTTIDPPRVIVGQKATLRVLVLGPNYMPAPPVIPDFQLRNAVTQPLGAVNQVETHDGVTYAGVQYEHAIYPQEPGAFAIADQQVTVTYAAEPPKSTQLTIPLPRLAFEAFIPEAAQNLDPFIAASALTVEQAVKQSAQNLKVGDSVTRAVTIKAEGTPAMLLPPTTFANIDGLEVYPGQPSVTDNLDRRTGSSTASRVDEATYMLQAAGEYTLPALDIAWWNVRDSKIEHTRADAVALHVADNPALRTGGAVDTSRARRDWRAVFDWILDHLLISAIALVAFGALLWLAPLAVRAVRQFAAQRRSAYLNSEACWFARLKAAGHDRDPAKVYFALLNWLQRFEPVAPAGNLGALKQAAADPELDREIASIETALFAPQSGTAPNWSPRRLLKRVSLVRRRLLRSAPAQPRQKILPDSLNPVMSRPQINPLRRPVAR
ncbi:MAG TPA: BatD family protein [Pseudolabrys sp.]